MCFNAAVKNYGTLLRYCSTTMKDQLRAPRRTYSSKTAVVKRPLHTPGGHEGGENGSPCYGGSGGDVMVWWCWMVSTEPGSLYRDKSLPALNKQKRMMMTIMRKKRILRIL